MTMHYFNKVFLMTVLTLGFSASSTAQSLLPGSGTESDPYVISSKDGLIAFTYVVNGGDYDAWAIMTSDIDMEGTTLAPIAPSSATSPELEGASAFTGHFDGQGHEISKLKLEQNSAYTTMGLFGTVSGTVTRVGLVGLSYTSDTSGGFYGGIAGAVLKGGTVSQCYVRDASFSSAPATLGFLVGANFGGTISDCYAYCEWGQANGMVGTNTTLDGTPVNGKVQNCYCNMNLVGDATYTGSVTESEGELSKVKFTGGYVAWRLNKGVTDGTQAWYQTLTDAYSDNFPTMDTQQGTVYERVFCNNVKGGYTNYYNRIAHAELQYVPADAPSCYNNGHVAYWHCSVCGHDFSEEACITDITGHTATVAHHMPTHYLTTPTCVTQGKAMECWGCAVCGHWFSDEACTTEITEPADGDPALGWLTIEGESGDWTHAMSGTYLTLCTETTSTEKSTRTMTFTAPRNMEGFSMRYYLEQPGWASETISWYPNIETEIAITVNGEVRYSVDFGLISWSFSGRDGWYDADLGHLGKGDKVVISVTYEGAYKRQGEERASVTFHYKPLSHNLKEVERKELICLQAVEAHWECADCQQLFTSNAHPTRNSDLTTLEALTTGNGTHNITKHDIKEATCCTAGNKTYYSCDICNGIFSDSEGYFPYTTYSPTLYPDNNATLTTEGHYWYTTKRATVMGTVLHNVAEIETRNMMSERSVPYVRYTITEDGALGDGIVRFVQECNSEDLVCYLTVLVNGHVLNMSKCEGNAIHDIPLGKLEKGDIVDAFFNYKRQDGDQPEGRIYIGLEYTYDHQLTTHIPQGTATCIGDVTEHWTCASCGKNFLANEPGSDDAITTDPVIDESTAVADAHTFDDNDRCVYCGLQTRHCEIGDTKIRLMEDYGGFVANEDIVINDGDHYICDTDFTAPKTTYRRTLPAADVWQAWYMPYDVEVSDLNAAGVEVAYLAGILYDEDESAFVAFLPMHSGTVSAHTPYVIKSADTRLVLETSNANFRRSDLISPVTIQSAFDEFTFSGLFAPSQPTDDWYALNKQGNFQKVGASTILQPYRIILTVESRTGVPYGHSSSGQSSIRAMVLGEDGTTGINLYENEDEDENIYDLQGQRVSNIRSGSVYIMNGKKYIAK